jgi:hypothetical protein
MGHGAFILLVDLGCATGRRGEKLNGLGIYAPSPFLQRLKG